MIRHVVDHQVSPETASCNKWDCNGMIAIIFVRDNGNADIHASLRDTKHAEWCLY